MPTLRTTHSPAMRMLRECGVHAAAEWRRVDRRIRLVLLVLLVLVLFRHTLYSVVVANVPGVLRLGVDACAVWEARHWSFLQSTKEEWWHKLCRLEKDMGEIDYECKDNREMGNRLVCFDSNLVPKENCIVYSFGIDYDFRFDDAMAGVGCTVYSFDPSMNMSEHKHAERVYFKVTGLSGSDNDHFQPRMDGYVRKPTTWRMRRLTSIMKELGHPQGSLTILKIDIESYEWDVVDDILSTEGLFASIPQVLIEWHLFAEAPPRSRYDELVSIYFRFKGIGFRKFFWKDEGRDHRFRNLFTQSETSWVNPRFM